jgi:gas vesicle protein
MNKTSRIIVAFAAGAAAGILAGILMAPGKGTDTRKKIMEAGKRVSDTVSETIAACGKCRKEFAESHQES